MKDKNVKQLMLWEDTRKRRRLNEEDEGEYGRCTFYTCMNMEH
jgi:hypothetical protein